MARTQRRRNSEQSHLEEHLWVQFRALAGRGNFPLPNREYKFHPVRRWRSDFAWPDHGLLLEVEGGVYPHMGSDGVLYPGRHVTPGGFTADAEKYNEAALLGYRVLRVTKKHIRDGTAVNWVLRALDRRLIP